MFRDLFNKCLAGSSEACEKIYILYWLLPRLEKMLKKLFGLAIVPLLPPRPGPDPLIDSGFLRERDVVQAILGDPNPQPSIISREVRLKASIATRDGLTRMVDSLNADIEKLKSEKKAR